MEAPKGSGPSEDVNSICSNHEVFAPESLPFLSAEEVALGHMVRDAMVLQLGLDSNDLHFVAVDSTRHGIQVFVVDSSPNGQHIGRYSQIIENRKNDGRWYALEVDDRWIDPLKGMTRDVYCNMVKGAQLRGELVMPDSVELSHQTELPWTATMLTGEPLTPEGDVLIASFSSDKVDIVGFNPNRGGISIRVRPSVQIAPFSEVEAFDI